MFFSYQPWRMLAGSIVLGLAASVPIWLTIRTQHYPWPALAMSAAVLLFAGITAATAIRMIIYGWLAFFGTWTSK